MDVPNQSIAVTIARPAAIFWEDISPPIPRIGVGVRPPVYRVVAAEDLPWSVKFETSVFMYLVETLSGNALLAVVDIQAPTFVIAGWQFAERRCLSRV